MRRRIALVVWLAGSIAATTFLVLRLQSTDRKLFLPGETSGGHYQIELACESCHTPYEGVPQTACLKCHEEELRVAEDSHPRSKFIDPRNAERVAKLDARRCVSCHVEHRPEITTTMGVTLARDNCFYCHSDIAKERPSHEGMTFTTCDSAGCHKFHDNRALYEEFLVKHRSQPDLLPAPTVRERVPLRTARPLTAFEHDAPPTMTVRRALLSEWADTAHARGAVNCRDCHDISDTSGVRRWSDDPGHNVCESCHKMETEGFLAGKHGMRLAAGLSPMSPAMARLPMRSDAAERRLSCVSCHGAHRFASRNAAVDACLGCHADGHSLAYKASPHFAAGTGVTCATCHLPRELHRENGADVVRIQHNQNWNLRPNEKMIRDVCMNCHGLAFSIDALADRKLIETNFQGRPSRHVESIEMAARKAAISDRN